MSTTVNTLKSKDGTSLAYEITGEGPPVILVGGAFNDRTTVAGLAAALSPRFTAVTYDRRGRGDSGDPGDLAMEREVEDLGALIDRVGGSAHLFGHSSGAVLALEAAVRGVARGKLALYEPVYVVEGSRPRPAYDLAERIQTMLREGRRDDAVALFQTEVVGLPPEVVEGMKASPFWPFLAHLATSLPHDLALYDPGLPLPAARLAAIQIPTLVMAGSGTFGWIQTAARTLAGVIPGARYVEIEGQDHGVLQHPDALEPMLGDFLL